jgi:hypothetical protein
VTARFAALLAAMGATGCLSPQFTPSVGDGTIVRDTKDPAQYRSALPRDVQGTQPMHQEAYGKSCRTMLSWPPFPPTPFIGSASAASLLPWPSFDVQWGNEGYARATQRALESAGGGFLFDVRADVHTTAVLGIFQTDCIEVHGLVAKEGPGPTPAPSAR